MRTSEFLEDVKRHISVPTYQPRFTDADILKLANDEQMTTIVEQITSLREEFFVVTDDVVFPATTGRLAIPARAIGRVIRDLWLSNTDSDSLNDYRPLAKIDLDDVLMYRNEPSGEGPFAWYIKNDNIFVHPPSTLATYGKLSYSQRPSDLVLESRTATVVSFTDSTVTVDEVPDNIEVGLKCDITQVEPSFNIVIKDAVVTNVSPTTITFAGYDATNPLTGFEAGDIVSLRRETSVVQLPEDWHHSLVWATCLAVAVPLGVPQFIEQAKAELADSIRAARNLTSPRAESSRPKVMDPRGLLRSNTYARKFPMVSV